MAILMIKLEIVEVEVKTLNRLCVTFVKIVSILKWRFLYDMDRP